MCLFTRQKANYFHSLLLPLPSHTPDCNPTINLSGPKLPTLPENREINFFKAYSFIIFAAPGERPFKDKHPADIVSHVNAVLAKIDAPELTSKPEINGVRILLSGDVKFYASARILAKWVMDHRDPWAKSADEHLDSNPRT
ncbi:hypothetical protein O181_037714 [Austropuccinia psidii MF-1]|uniref:Uncharacterized protein n=1 Tax=Austropuccinia psidii MF-1 TaxID=1389203 RepID=A0A9Q3D728_9BASI|nr:hypothetical protein [Austropuccinia psidii MF-1]